MLYITGPNGSSPRTCAIDATKPVNHCMAAMPRNIAIVNAAMARPVRAVG